jgi:2-polyprenyl-6-methoxyphenol hydroxylase-like FAD-dependent oxidoreductase
MTQHKIPTSTDVLIVGAGPTGITLAASLKQVGVDCVVIDQLPDAPDDTRAGFVQPRTLEYLHRIQVAGPMIDDGLKGRGAAFADVDRDLIRLSYDTVDSPYPFLLMIPQWQTQRHLDQRFAELGGSVLRGVRLLDLVPEFPGSAATVVDSDGTLRVINARFVAGCDGLHSRVRNQVGIGFPGSSPAQMFAVADVRFDGWPFDRVETAFSLSPHGMLISSPLPGDIGRVVASVAPGTPTPTQHDVIDLIQTRGAGWMRKATVKELLSSSTWRVHERVASQFRHANTFLLGDAAHTHSPAGGQGMNTGIQDAGNLAWKLHQVLSLGAPESLLDSYEAERLPNAQKLIQFTHQIVTVATLTGHQQRQLRNDILAALSQVPGAIEALSLLFSQIAIGYGDSNEPFAPGTRVNPDTINADDLAWSLLTPDAASPDLPAGFKVTVSKDVSRPVAVRPDGIVAGPELVHELFGFILAPAPLATNEVDPPTKIVEGQELSQQPIAHPAPAQFAGAR